MRKKMRSRMDDSRSVVILGIALLSVALIWRLMIGGNPMSGWMGYSLKGGQTRKVLVLTGDGEAFVGQVVNHGMEEIGEGSSSAVPKDYSENQGTRFSFARDVLRIYGPVDWGKFIRIFMYMSGGGLLLISNIKRR